MPETAESSDGILGPNFMADVYRRVEEQAKRRTERRRQLQEKVISPEPRIVAWIDVLGFRQQLERAKTAAEMKALYRKMLFVQEQFGSSHASEEPEEIAEINANYGRTVHALSDGLVITASPNAPARIAITLYDLLMSFIGELIQAQANCAANGIFVRGGISIGPHFHEQDFLLSPALVKAYTLETARASYPVIIIDSRDVEQLRKLPGIRRYAADADPSLAYFGKFRSPAQRKGERYLFLDYLRFLAHPDNHDWYSKEDYEAYRICDKTERNRIYMESHWKTAIRFMEGHKKHVVASHAAASSDRVRAKYRWLAKYHNRTLRAYGGYPDSAHFKDGEV